MVGSTIDGGNGRVPSSPSHPNPLLPALPPLPLPLPAAASPFHPLLAILQPGGGWETGTKADEKMIAKKLAARGIAAFSINYRLAPAHPWPGGKREENDNLHAVCALCACVLCAVCGVLCTVLCALCYVCCVLCAVCCVLCAMCCVLCAMCCVLLCLYSVLSERGISRCNNNTARVVAAHTNIVQTPNHHLPSPLPPSPSPAQLEDAAAAVAFVAGEGQARFGVDPSRVAACGYSAGGHLAMLLGLTRDVPVCCVAAGGAPWNFGVIGDDDASLAFLLGGSRAECPEAYATVCPTVQLRRVAGGGDVGGGEGEKEEEEEEGHAASSLSLVPVSSRSFFLYHGSMDETSPGSSLEPFVGELKEGLARMKGLNKGSVVGDGSSGGNAEGDAEGDAVQWRLLDDANHLSAAINHELAAELIGFLEQRLAAVGGGGDGGVGDTPDAELAGEDDSGGP